MCPAMNVFQMRGILILHLMSNTIAHPLKTIAPSTPKEINFATIFTLKRPPCSFKAPIITLIRLSTHPLLQ
jgi:hypothetical protein